MSLPERFNVEIKDITPENRKDKLEKAIKAISKILQVPATINPKEYNKEQFPYKAQNQLYRANMERIGLMNDDLYSRLCTTLGLRPVSTFTKSIDPKAPKLLKNEILWNPETGTPISQKELDALLKAVDKFMNRKSFKKEFVISQAAVSRIIANLRKNSAYADIKDKNITELKYKNKTYDYYNTYEKLENSFPSDYSDLKFEERITGNYIADMTDKSKSGIRNVLDQGFKAGKSKGEVSQELFDKFGDLNRNWDMIVEAEGANTFNAQYIDEERKDVTAGEPLYFIRREYGDAKTCNFCKQAVDNPIIARWSDVPLQNENIKDSVASIAVWAGKTNYGIPRKDWNWAEGINHVNCRGYWERYFPEIGDISL